MYGGIWIGANGGITKHEKADVIDREAVPELSDSLGLDSTSTAVTFNKMAQPCRYIMRGSKNAQRRSGTGLIMVHGYPAGAVIPAAESRQSFGAE
jgi:hypothetical protein